MTFTEGVIQYMLEAPASVLQTRNGPLAGASGLSVDDRDFRRPFSVVAGELEWHCRASSYRAFCSMISRLEIVNSGNRWLFLIQNYQAGLQFPADYE